MFVFVGSWTSLPRSDSSGFSPIAQYVEVDESRLSCRAFIGAGVNGLAWCDLSLSLIPSIHLVRETHNGCRLRIEISIRCWPHVCRHKSIACRAWICVGGECSVKLKQSCEHALRRWFADAILFFFSSCIHHLKCPNISSSNNIMLQATATVTRVLEEHSDLSGASLGKIISTAMVLGMVHVLTGPDHLSAIAAMTTGYSWKAFSLGIRWGCGHSLGLLIMTAIFFAAGQTVNLNSVGAYLNYVVGAFMIVLGAWTAVNVRKKYHMKLKELDELPTSPSMIKSPDCRSPVGEITAITGSHGHLVAPSWRAV